MAFAVPKGMTESREFREKFNSMSNDKNIQRDVAEKLTDMTGLRVTVHYKEYKGVLPWRGYEKAIVDHVDDDPVPSTLYDDESIFL